MARSNTPDRLAKLLAYILGRRPDEFGLAPDTDGYVRTKDLLKAITEEDGWRHIRQGHIDEVLYTLTEPPVGIKDRQIRAKNRKQLTELIVPETLPKLLYTTVRQRAYPNAHRKGVFPGAAAYVVLSSDMRMAERIGKRIDRSPVTLTVRTADAVLQGVNFLQTGELYLSRTIPAGCFSGPPLPKERPEMVTQETQKPLKPERPVTPGTFSLDPNKPAKDREKRRRKKELSRQRNRDRKRKQRERRW